jgi:hypothetical protein
MCSRKNHLSIVMEVARETHAMRNEVVEELTPDFVGASGLISASALQKPSLNREKSQRNEQQGRGEAGKPGKEATRCHSEQRACPTHGLRNELNLFHRVALDGPSFSPRSRS